MERRKEAIIPLFLFVLIIETLCSFAVCKSNMIYATPYNMISKLHCTEFMGLKNHTFQPLESIEYTISSDDTLYMYSETLQGQKYKMIVDKSHTVINYAEHLSTNERTDIEFKLKHFIDEIENYGYSLITPYMDENMMHAVCSFLGKDSLNINFAQRLFLEDSTVVWTSNSISLRFVKSTDIYKFLRKHEIKYHDVEMYDNNSYFIYLIGPVDCSIKLCNELIKDEQVYSASPNFNFFIAEDTDTNIYE